MTSFAALVLLSVSIVNWTPLDSEVEAEQSALIDIGDGFTMALPSGWMLRDGSPGIPDGAVLVPRNAAAFDDLIRVRAGQPNVFHLSSFDERPIRSDRVQSVRQVGRVQIRQAPRWLDRLVPKQRRVHEVSLNRDGKSLVVSYSQEQPFSCELPVPIRRSIESLRWRTYPE